MERMNRPKLPARSEAWAKVSVSPMPAATSTRWSSSMSAGVIGSPLRTLATMSLARCSLRKCRAFLWNCSNSLLATLPPVPGRSTSVLSPSSSVKSEYRMFLLDALDEVHEVAQPLAGVFEHGVADVHPPLVGLDVGDQLLLLRDHRNRGPEVFKR